MKKGLVLVLTVAVLALMLSGCAKQLTEEELYAKATELQENQEWTELVETYDEIISTFPDSPKTPETAYNLGMLYANNLKEFKKAIDVWNTLIEKYPESDFIVKAKFLIGYTYANELKDYENARERYSAFLQEYPDDVLAPSVKWELENLGVDPDAMMFEATQEN